LKESRKKEADKIGIYITDMFFLFLQLYIVLFFQLPSLVSIIEKKSNIRKRKKEKEKSTAYRISYRFTVYHIVFVVVGVRLVLMCVLCVM
jgi:Ca2+/Na+ antiporter